MHACRRMKLKRNYRFMQYHDHAKGTPTASPAHVERANPDRLLSGTNPLGLLHQGTTCLQPISQAELADLTATGQFAGLAGNSACCSCIAIVLSMECRAAWQEVHDCHTMSILSHTLQVQVGSPLCCCHKL